MSNKVRLRPMSEAPRTHGAKIIARHGKMKGWADDDNWSTINYNEKFNVWWCDQRKKHMNDSQFTGWILDVAVLPTSLDE